jgi:hypothetical protein
VAAAARRVLLVEGKDDRHVVLALLQRHQVEEVFKVEPLGDDEGRPAVGIWLMPDGASPAAAAFVAWLRRALIDWSAAALAASSSTSPSTPSPDSSPPPTLSACTRADGERPPSSGWRPLSKGRGVFQRDESAFQRDGGASRQDNCALRGACSIFPHEVRGRRNKLSVFPHEVSGRRNKLSVFPHEVSGRRNKLSVFPHKVRDWAN